MKWENIVGHEPIKQKLKESIESGRISHAQLFIGKVGWGTLPLAIAYAAEILASDKGPEIKNKVATLQHADIHFTFPVTSSENNSKPKSSDYIREWRNFILQNPYGNLFEWLEFNEVEKKLGSINVTEAEEIGRFISLNSYEGSYQFVIIWLPEFMNEPAANKLLKAIEEPPQKTIFLLVAERDDLLLPTITSRCQNVVLNRLSDEEVSQFLIHQQGIEPDKAQRFARASSGDLNTALKLINSSNDEFESYFIHWVRNAFMAAKSAAVLKNLIQWSNELSSWPREKQKQFLTYCSEIFRQALMQTYGVDNLVFLEIQTEGFKWDKFSNFIHGANIEEILAEINEAIYHIERNANGKIVLFDLSIKLTRLLHAKVTS